MNTDRKPQINTDKNGQVVLEYFVILAVLAVITIIFLVGGPGSGNKNIITSALNGYYTKAINKIAP